ncbi:hypothetical protein DPV78_001186 [Talaromyces pinophilus]|nr:hypothetical protein DPV78_001186 [Talaromyces pinophilus]
MAQPLARQGLALVTLHSNLGIAFARYLLKNTSLPVVFAGGNPKYKTKEMVLERLSDIEGAPSRLHYMYGDPAQRKNAWDIRQYLRQNFPQQSIRLLIALRGSSTFKSRYTNFSGVTHQSILRHYQRTVIGHELLMNGLNGFLPTTEAFEVSETDNCKLPAHAIWALRLGRRASISQNTASVLPTDHAASAATLQLTKSFDNFLRWRCKGNAISVAFHPGTKGTSVRNPGFDPEDVLSEDEAVEKIMKVLTTMPAEQARGRFWDYNGEEILP